MWGMIGVLEGRETEMGFHREDDGSVEGFADLTFLGTSYNEPGSVSVLVPPSDDIHAIHNESGAPSVAIHVYGGHLEQVLRHTFEPEKKTVAAMLENYTITC